MSAVYRATEVIEKTLTHAGTWPKEMSVHEIIAQALADEGLLAEKHHIDLLAQLRELRDPYRVRPYSHGEFARELTRILEGF